MIRGFLGLRQETTLKVWCDTLNFVTKEGFSEEDAKDAGQKTALALTLLERDFPLHLQVSNAWTQTVHRYRLNINNSASKGHCHF